MASKTNCLTSSSVMSRRAFIQIASAGLGATYLTLKAKNAYAIDPFTASLVIAVAPSIVSAIASFIQQSRSSALAKSIKEMELNDSYRHESLRVNNEWLNLGFSSGNISYARAYDTIRSQIASVSPSMVCGSVFSLNHGLPVVERNGSGGYLIAPELDLVSRFMTQGKLPVPTTNPQPIFRQEKTKLMKLAADGLGISDTEFNQKFVLATTRPFSSARTPKMSHDVSVITAFNREQMAHGGMVNMTHIATAES